MGDIEEEEDTPLLVNLTSRECSDLCNLSNAKTLQVVPPELPPSVLNKACCNDREMLLLLKLASADVRTYYKIMNEIGAMSDDKQKQRVFAAILQPQDNGKPKRNLVHVHFSALLEQHCFPSSCKDSEERFVQFLDCGDQMENIAEFSDNYHQSFLNFVKTLPPKQILQYFKIVDEMSFEHHEHAIPKIIPDIEEFLWMIAEVRQKVYQDRAEAHWVMSLEGFSAFIAETFTLLAWCRSAEKQTLLQYFETYAGSLAKDLLRFYWWPEEEEMLRTPNQPPSLLTSDKQKVKLTVKAWMELVLEQLSKEEDFKWLNFLLGFNAHEKADRDAMLQFLCDLKKKDENLRRNEGDNYIIVCLLKKIFEKADLQKDEAESKAKRARLADYQQEKAEPSAKQEEQ